MSKETYMENVVGLANDKLQKWNSLEEEASSFWSEIVENRYDFEVHRNEVETLKTLTKEDLLVAFDQFLSPKNSQRRKLEIWAIGAEGVASNGRPEVEPDEFLGETIDEKVHYFHKLSGKTWGKIY
jgi:secreted Zn-dependent insulinase-like peptidase